MNPQNYEEPQNPTFFAPQHLSAAGEAIGVRLKIRRRPKPPSGFHFSDYFDGGERPGFRVSLQVVRPIEQGGLMGSLRGVAGPTAFHQAVVLHGVHHDARLRGAALKVEQDQIL